MNITPEQLATLLMSLAALGGAGVAIIKAYMDKSKIDADSGKSNMETIALLSKQLQEAYIQIDDLRKQIEDLDYHKEYQDYLLRGIARLNGSLAANEISIPWLPVSFQDYKAKYDKKGA